METLAKRLAWARTKKEWTQAQLAKAAKVSQGTIGNLEAGTRATARSITEIANALDVDVFWLANGKGGPDGPGGAGQTATFVEMKTTTPPPAACPGWFPPDAFDLLEQFYRLDDRRREDVLRYVQTLSSRSRSGSAATSKK